MIRNQAVSSSFYETSELGRADIIYLSHFMTGFLRRKGVGEFLNEDTALTATKYKVITLHGFGKAIFFLFIFIGYQVLTYVDISAKNPGVLVVISAFAPIMAGLLLISRRTRYKAFWILSGAISGMIIVRNSTTIAHYIGWICMLQRSAIFILLAFTFGLTLRSGHMPLISRIAEMIHGPLSMRLARYTRKVTVAWTLFFLALTMVLFLMFFILGERVWVLFSGTASAVLIASMFIMEYVVRCRQIPISERGGMVESIRTYLGGRQSVSNRKSNS